MNDIEDRLRDALAARAATVQDDGRYAALPAPKLTAGFRMRWMLPVAAAAAMVALIASVTITVQRDRAPEAAAPAASTAVRIPPFYAASVVTERVVKQGRTVEEGPWGVYDSETGERVAEFPELVDAQVAGVGDGRTFFIAGREARRTGTRFIKITLGADGRIERQESLPLPGSLGNDGVAALAASRDGRRLAFGTYKKAAECRERCSGDSGDSGDTAAYVVVVDVATGRVQRWKAPRDAFVYGLSWSYDGRKLAYAVGAEPPRGMVGVLDATPGRELSQRLTVNRVVFRKPGTVVARPGTANFVAAMDRKKTSTEERTLFAEFSAKAGEEVRLWEVGVWFNPLLFDETGRALIGWREGRLFWLDGDRLNPIAMPDLDKNQRLQVAW